MNEIQQALSDAWMRHGKTRQTQKGFISGNAVCCIHNGESMDKRSRGGLKIEGESIGYNCFNCGFSTGWKPGRHLGHKVRKLMGWMNMDEGEIQRLTILAMQLKEYHIEHNLIAEEIVVNFEAGELPPESRLIADTDTEFVNYLKNRGLSTADYDFCCTTHKLAQMSKRVIIPFTWEHDIVGYTGRLITKGIPKYYNKMPTGYVFNIPAQKPDRTFVLVTEGPFDAICIGGVAVLGNSLNDTQVEIIEQLNKQVVLVPDAGKAGKALINEAIEYGWHVSFPTWLETCGDVNDAIIRYGKIFVLKDIIENTMTTKLKIKMMMRKQYD